MNRWYEGICPAVTARYRLFHVDSWRLNLPSQRSWYMAAKPGPLRPHEERQSYARRIPKQPPPGEPALGDSFLIVTEGEVTEKLYFESVRAALQLNPVTVRVVH